ncbi:major facilitator superfamily domain-containing protein [Xylaria longipes]|nr:major facilitator superfamily domain-containing protein [Xylaria longipes]
MQTSQDIQRPPDSDRELPLSEPETTMHDSEKTPSPSPDSVPQEPPKPDDPEPVSGAHLAFMLGSLTLASFLIFLDTSIVSTAIPKITDEFHSLPDVGWYGSAYQLGSAVFVPLSGGIYQNFKLKWSYLIFFAVFEAGSAVCGAAPSSAALIVGRVIAGIGASGLNSGAFTILSCAVPIERRPAILGFLFGIAQVGAVLGPLIGGAFTTGYTWRWCFYINLPLGALVAGPLLIMRVGDQVPKQKPMTIVRNLHRHFDLIGAVLFTAAIVQLILAAQLGGNQFHWNSSQVIGLFVGAGVTWIVWMFWNGHKGENGLLPFPIIKKKEVLSSGINYAFLLATVYGSLYFLPIYFQAVNNDSAIKSGVNLLAIILPQLVSAVVGGKIMQDTGYVAPFAVVGCAINAIGSGLFSLLQPSTSTGKWVGFSIISGFGRGVALQAPIIATQAAVSPKEVASATAFVVWCQYIGPTIFLTLFNVLFDTGLRSQLHEKAPNVDAGAVILAGATKFRDVVAIKDLPNVLIAYSTSLDYTFYLAAGAGVISWVAAWGMGWNNIRKKTVTAADPVDVMIGQGVGAQGSVEEGKA